MLIPHKNDAENISSNQCNPLALCSNAPLIVCFIKANLKVDSMVHQRNEENSRTIPDI